MNETIPEGSALDNAIQRAYKKDRRQINIKIAIDALNRSMNHYDALYACGDIGYEVYEPAMADRVGQLTKLMALIIE